jgi:hypothetical protein
LIFTNLLDPNDDSIAVLCADFAINHSTVPEINRQQFEIGQYMPATTAMKQKSCHHRHPRKFELSEWTFRGRPTNVHSKLRKTGFTNHCSIPSSHKRHKFSTLRNQTAPLAAPDETPFARALQETNIVLEIEDGDGEVDEERTAPPCGNSESPVVQALKKDPATSAHDSVEILVPHRMNSWQRGVAITARRENHI